MMVELEEMKRFLRVDYPEDDDLILGLISTAENLCRDIARAEDDGYKDYEDTVKAAVLYATAYLYDHRESPNYNALNLNLRAMLFGIRKETF